jgi:hypothetical protein
MEPPCPWCGANKTESVPHGFIYNLLWRIGYHLRRCSCCNRKRILKRGDRNQPRPDEMTWEELTERFNREVAEAKSVMYKASYGHVRNMAANSLPESSGLRTQSTGSAVGVLDANDDRGYGACPKCGSTAFRLSHRYWYEKILGRPKMAGCFGCGCRFPYPDWARAQKLRSKPPMLNLGSP